MFDESNPDDDPESLRAAPGGKLISTKTYRDRDAFSAFVRRHGRAIIADIKKLLTKEAEAGRRAGLFKSWDDVGHALAGTKRCRTCGDTKRVAEMKKGARMCRACDARRDREARRANSERVRALQRRRWHARTDKQRAAHRERGKTANARRINQAAVAEYRRKHPERVRAQWRAREAERRGDIVRPATCQAIGCETTTRLHRHHNDYRAPVDVIFVCHRHHEHVHHVGDVPLKPSAVHSVAHAPREP